MKIKPKFKKQILSVSSRSSSVVKIEEDVVTFQVFFEIDPEAAIEERVTTCNFRVYDEKKAEPQKLKLKALEARAAFQRSTSKKSSAISEISKSVSVGVVDISKQIPNDRISKILAGGPVRLQKRLKSESSSAFESSVSNLDSSKEESVTPESSLKSLYLDMLHRKSKDPASEINSAKFHAPIISSVRGVRTTSDMTKVDKKLESARVSLVRSSGPIVKSSFESESTNLLEIPFNVRLKKFQLKNYTVEVESKNQTVKFKVNFRDVYEKHIIPTQAPQVHLTNVGSYRVIKIKQIDVNSTSVSVYRKSITGDDSETFTKVTTIPLLPGKEVQFTDRTSQSEKSLYRVIPLNEISLSSGEFSSAVAPGANSSKKKSEPDNLTLLATETANGVKVSVFNIPNEIIAVRIVRKNLTTHEPTFSTPPGVVDGSLRKFDKSTSSLEFYDRPSRVNAIYEYKVVMIDSYGGEKESQRRAIIHFSGDIEDQEGYSLYSSSLRIGDGGSPNVSFQVDAPTSQASLDLVYSTLIDAGLDSLYADEIKSNKELFSKIVSLEILRFDTVTGLNESFGVVKIGLFQDDSKSQRFSNVSPLVSGRKYIYQFRLLVRAPGTIFSESTVQKNDLETGKSYSVSMKKFNSPFVLKRGTLSSTSKQLRVSSRTSLKIDPAAGSAREMIQGRTALTGEVIVTVPHIDTDITDLSVEETPRGNVVKWKISEGFQKIDHIVIYAEYNGKLAPLRALHFFGNESMVYLDDELNASLDDVKYYVQPVFQNFSQGQLIGPVKENDSAA